MKIIKIEKKGKGKYKLTFDNNESLILYEDVIVNHMLVLNKDVDLELLQKINEDNYFLTIYYQVIKYISNRLRSKKEVEDYLKQKEYDEKMITKVIDKLIIEGYIDDYRFAQAYFNDRLHLSKDGINKIRRDLEHFGISETIIDQLTTNIDEDIIRDKMMKLIDKQIKINTKYSGHKLKNKLFNYLLNLGYDSTMILDYLNKIDFQDDKKLEQAFWKLYNKYVNKYDDYQLKQVIKQKLYQKGYQDIDLENLMP